MMSTGVGSKSESGQSKIVVSRVVAAATTKTSDNGHGQLPCWLDPVLLTCDVCGDRRDEHHIAVRTVLIRGLLERFGSRRTVRYCNDRRGCTSELAVAVTGCPAAPGTGPNLEHAPPAGCVD